MAIWKAAKQNGIIKLLVVVEPKVGTVRREYYYGKAERDKTFFLWMRSQKKDDIRKGWEEAERRLDSADGSS